MRTLQRRLVRVAAEAVAVVGWGAVIVAPTGASAAIVTTPLALSPGDQYRLAFVTSTERDALSSNIADYNAFVTTAANSQADLLALGATWKVIASTDVTDAQNNIGTNPLVSTGFPIVLLDGNSQFAANNTDLWDGALDFPVNIRVDGLLGSGTTVWTGNGPTGGSTATVLGSAFATTGVVGRTGPGWIELGGEQHF